MNHIRAFLSAGRACLRRARPTNATEGVQFDVARWLLDGKVSVRYGVDVPYPKLRLSPAAAEDSWGIAEVEIRQPDGKFVTSKFQVEILTHRSEAPDDVLIISKEEVAAVFRNISDREHKIELIKKDVENRFAVVEANLSKLEEQKSDAPPP